jgi:hypothetical protein
VLTNDSSRELLRERFETVISTRRRERFREAALGGDPRSDEETAEVLASVARDVLEDLAIRDTTVTLTHRAPLSVPSREAYLYTFMTTHDPAVLTSLSLPDPVRACVETGAETLIDDDPETAAARFEDAIHAAGSGDGIVTTRVLAAYAYHVAGEDAAAIDYIEEALHLETRAWSAKLVGYAADAHRPEKFRRGKLGARVYVRWTTNVSNTGAVSVSIGPAGGEFESLSGRDECMPVEHLWPDSRVEVRLAGDLSDLPTVQTYYVAVGVVDLEVYEARSVEQVLLSGPAAAGATERLRFE